MESVLEQHRSIVDGAIVAIEQERYSDALGWLRTAIEEPGTAPLIHRKIIEVMRAVGGVAKAGHYKEGNTEYNYRRADDVFDALHPAMAEAGIYPKPIVTEVIRNWGTTRGGSPRLENTLRITYRFTAEDGSYEDVPIEVDNWNTSDKGIGAGMTVALRIALLQLFVISTGDPDPDAVREETGTAIALSPSLAAYIQAGVESEPLDRLGPLYELLTAHAAPDSSIPGDAAGRVWWEPWALRYVNEVEKAEKRGNDALRDLWRDLTPFGRAFRLGQGRDVNKAITEASMRWNDKQKQSIDRGMGAIADSETEPELEAAVALVKSLLTEHHILAADSLALLEVAEKKRARLREANAKAEENLSTWGDAEPNVFGTGDDDYVAGDSN